MPGAKRGAVNPIGRSAEARRGARIEVRVADPVAGRARAIIERVKIGIPNGLPRPAEPIKREEGRVADLLAGAGLGQRHTGKEQEEKWKLRISEKEEELARYSTELRDARQMTDGRDRVIQELEDEVSRQRSENDRIQKESQAKINQLNDRIKELNQRVMMAEGGGPKTATNQGGGFFKK